MTRDTGSILISESIEERFGVELENAAPERPRIVLRPGGRVDGDPASIEIAFFSNDSYPDRVIEFVRVVSESRALRWLHTFSAGVDNPWFRAMLDQGVRVTTSSGAAASAIAQSVMMFILALSRDLPAWFRAQSDRVWSRHEVQELPDQVLGVAGLGPIGLETARLGSAFGMRVIGLRRRVRCDEPCETWTFDRLDEMLALADFLVLALPLAPETRGLLNARTIGLMKPAARIVNVGRGALIDEPALIEALRAGGLAGAALDVFETEPLPRESPLWGMPQVIVTPHNCGTNPGNPVRAARIFLDNLARYPTGEPLFNEAEPE